MLISPTRSQSPEMHSGGAGIFSTASDYLSLLVPLINDGIGGNGRRILKAETVSMMLEDHLKHLGITKGVSSGSAKSDLDWSLTESLISTPEEPKGWGLTFALSKKQFASGRPAGTADWGGIANLSWLAAPGKLALVIFNQILPYGDDGFAQLQKQAEKLIWSDLEI